MSEIADIVVGSRVIGRSKVFINKRGRVDRIADFDGIKKYYITWDDGNQNLVKEKSIALFIPSNVNESPSKTRKGSYFSDIDINTPKKLSSNINDSLFDINHNNSYRSDSSLTPVSPSPNRNEKEYNPTSNIPGLSLSDTESKEATNESNNQFDIADFLERNRHPVNTSAADGKKKRDIESYCTCVQF
mmetsp:Transcript_9582/g.8570  ORF Transcript_9582/g.8570 Transcript_9582/m.8570 type:complete len:188 (-) Transcript_9582:67-630(-)